MPQDETGRGGGAAANHVLVRAADVGTHSAQDDPVRDLPADIDGIDPGAGLQFKGGIRGIDDFHDSRRLVRNGFVT